MKCGVFTSCTRKGKNVLFTTLNHLFTFEYAHKWSRCVHFCVCLHTETISASTGIVPFYKAILKKKNYIDNPLPGTRPWNLNGWNDKKYLKRQCCLQLEFNNMTDVSSTIDKIILVQILTGVLSCLDQLMVTKHIKKMQKVVTVL